MQSIFAHFPPADFSLFLGDMNYRVDLPSDRVRTLAASAAYSDILQHCQLNKVMQQHGIRHTSKIKTLNPLGHAAARQPLRRLLRGAHTLRALLQL